MATQIPPLLESYLSLPPETSQIVLSGILGASTNWLVLRYLYGLLKPGTTSISSAAAAQEDNVKVLLVSFLRDYAFWKDGAGRLGLNLDALTAQNKFYFVDGLSRLFLAPVATTTTTATATTTPHHHPPSPALRPGATPHAYLESPRIVDVARTLNAAVDRLQAAASGGNGGGAKVVLVLDQPDVLLAAAGAGDGVTSASLRDVVLDLREKVHATIMTVSADEPLVSSQTTTLEKEHAGFVLSSAHEAEAVLSLRLLDTGTAKDVSGVVRITRGGGVLDRAVEEHEYLYHVGGDGGVKVFERGQ